MEGTQIKISVIMPVYNGEKNLAAALDRVLSQTLCEIELICIDDGSTDGSIDIIRDRASRDSRVKVLTGENAGAAAARNRGMREATGKYLAFLDADDIFESDFLEALYLYAEENSLDVVVSEYDIYNDKTGKSRSHAPELHGKIFDTGAIISKNEFPDEIFLATSGNAWNKLFLRAFVEEKELRFLETVRIFEDAYFVIAALSLAERVGRIGRVLVHHRVHAQQTRVKLFSQYYGQIPDAYLAAKEFLRSHGMYVPLAPAFVNLTATRCYKVYNLLPFMSRKDYYNRLHAIGDGLGWHSELDSIEDADVKAFVACVRQAKHSYYLKCSILGRDAETVMKKLARRGLFGKKNNSARRKTL